MKQVEEQLIHEDCYVPVVALNNLDKVFAEIVKVSVWQIYEIGLMVMYGIVLLKRVTVNFDSENFVKVSITQKKQS